NVAKRSAPRTVVLLCAFLLGLWSRPIPLPLREPPSRRSLVLRKKRHVQASEPPGAVDLWNPSRDTANQGSSAAGLRGGKLIPNLSNPNQFLTWPRLWG